MGTFHREYLNQFACILVLIWTSNCSGTKVLKDPGQMISVDFKILKHDPYCGGAFPTDKQKDGRLSSLADQTFYLKRGKVNTDSVPSIAEVLTDSLGTFQLQLDTGTYCLIFPEKNLPYSDFLRTVSTESRYLQAGKESCFFQWWTTPEVVFDVSDTTRQIQSVLKRTCYTGFNPCMVYTGPLRR